MGLKEAKEHLKLFSLEDRIMEFEQSSATVELAAKAVGCEPKFIVKTMSFMVHDTPILILLAGTARIDNAKFKKQFHCKTKMMSADELDKFVGHAIGGVCPFGLKTKVAVYMDESLQGLDWVYPAAGTSNTAVRLQVMELEKAAKIISWVDISK